MYTASMFMGMLSTLCDYYEKKENLTEKTLGFIAYGSGAKSKVFEGKLVESWEKVIEKQKLFESLEKSKTIDINTYHQLHKKEKTVSVITPQKEWILESIETEKPNLIGARYYKWVK